MSSLSSGFAQVDKTDDADTFVQYLNLIHSLPFFQECKAKSYEKLNLSPGDSVLEIGCGNGVDIHKLAESVEKTGAAIGIDISYTMLIAARNSARSSDRIPEFILCNGQNLAFADATFHAVRSDRVLQHTYDPFAVVKEIARVTRSSGSVVIFEPDWETFIIWPGDYTICRKVLNYWCDNIPSGQVGRKLYAAFSDAGLKEIEVQPITLTVTDLELANRIFDLKPTFSQAVKQRIVNPEDIQRWEAGLVHADKTEQFFSSLTFFLVSGRKR